MQKLLLFYFFPVKVTHLINSPINLYFPISIFQPVIYQSVKLYYQNLSPFSFSFFLRSSVVAVVYIRNK